MAAKQTSWLWVQIRTPPRLPWRFQWVAYVSRRPHYNHHRRVSFSFLLLQQQFLFLLLLLAESLCIHAPPLLASRPALSLPPPLRCGRPAAAHPLCFVEEGSIRDRPQFEQSQVAWRGRAASKPLWALSIVRLRPRPSLAASHLPKQTIWDQWMVRSDIKGCPGKKARRRRRGWRRGRGREREREPAAASAA